MIIEDKRSGTRLHQEKFQISIESCVLAWELGERTGQHNISENIYFPLSFHRGKIE